MSEMYMITRNLSIPKEEWDPYNNYLFTYSQYADGRYDLQLPLKCLKCGKTFYLPKYKLGQLYSHKDNRKAITCNLECYYSYKNTYDNLIYLNKKIEKDNKIHITSCIIIDKDQWNLYNNYLFTYEEFLKSSDNDSLPFKCLSCGNIFYKDKYRIFRMFNNYKYIPTYKYCSGSCASVETTDTSIMRKKQYNIKQKRIADCLDSDKLYITRGLYINKDQWNPYNNYLFTYEEFSEKPLKSKLFFKCLHCGNTFNRNKSYFITTFKKSNVCKCKFCSIDCILNSKDRNYKAVKNHRSSNEEYIEEYLTNKFPKLDVKYNNRINGYELDIYIPSLSLAFEINGVFHYKNIYKKEDYMERKLKVDFNKYKMCKDNNIILHIVDISNIKHFKNRRKEYKDKIMKDHINFIVENIYNELNYKT